MWRVYGGAVLIIGGIAAFIEAHRHIPVPGHKPEFGLVIPAKGLSPTAYDLLRIGAWALVIFGTVIVVLGLIRYAVRYAGAEAPVTARTSANGASPPDEPVPAAETLIPGSIQATRPWDDGSHGEAVEPGLR